MRPCTNCTQSSWSARCSGSATPKSASPMPPASSAGSSSLRTLGRKRSTARPPPFAEQPRAVSAVSESASVDVDLDIWDREAHDRVDTPSTASSSGRNGASENGPVQPSGPSPARQNGRGGKNGAFARVPSRPRRAAAGGGSETLMPFRTQYPTGWNSPAFFESLRINNRVLDSGTLEELVNVATDELDRMKECDLGHVNMSSVVYRAAYFHRQASRQPSANGTPQREAHRRWKSQRDAADEMLTSIFALMGPNICAKFEGGEHVQPWDLAITLYSYAICGVRDDAVFNVCCERSLPMLSQFTPTDLSHVMWAAATLRNRSSPYILHELALRALQEVEGFKSRELSNFIWGMSRLQVRCPNLVAAASEVLTRCPERFETQELVLMLWSFTKMGYRSKTLAEAAGVHDAVLAVLCSPQRRDAALPQDISNTVWALGRGVYQVKDKHALRALAELALYRVDAFNRQEVSNVAYGFGRLLYCHEQLITALAKRTVDLRTRMSNQELCVVLWSLGKLDYVPEGFPFLDEIASELHSRLPGLPPLTVSNMIKAFAKLDYMPSEQLLNAVSRAVADKLSDYHMAELSNLLWGYQQLGWHDDKFFELVDDWVSEHIHMCSKHHARSITDSLRGLGFEPQQIITATRYAGLHF